MAGTIKIQERLRGVLYTPFYAALALRVPETEGLALEFVGTPNDINPADLVVDGGADILWGGPMRVMWARERDPSCDLVCFCEVVTRDPFTLLGHSERSDFRFEDLLDRRLAVVSEVQTPWLCLQDDLRRAGIAPHVLNRTPPRTMQENVQSFRRGEIDVLQTFEPFVDELLGAGECAVWYAAADRGAMAFTSLYTHRAFLKNRRADVLRLVRAIYRVQRWLVDADPDVVAGIVAPFFPDIPPSRLAGAIARYKALGVWGTNPGLSAAGYERLRASLVSGGFVESGTPFEITVDNSFADEVIAEDPPPLETP